MLFVSLVICSFCYTSDNQVAQAAKDFESTTWRYVVRHLHQSLVADGPYTPHDESSENETKLGNIPKWQRVEGNENIPTTRRTRTESRLSLDMSRNQHSQRLIDWNISLRAPSYSRFPQLSYQASMQSVELFHHPHISHSIYSRCPEVEPRSLDLPNEDSLRRDKEKRHTINNEDTSDNNDLPLPARFRAYNNPSNPRGGKPTVRSSQPILERYEAPHGFFPYSTKPVGESLPKSPNKCVSAYLVLRGDGAEAGLGCLADQEEGGSAEGEIKQTSTQQQHMQSKRDRRLSDQKSPPWLGFLNPSLYGGFKTDPLLAGYNELRFTGYAHITCSQQPALNGYSCQEHIDICYWILISSLTGIQGQPWFGVYLKICVLHLNAFWQTLGVNILHEHMFIITQSMV